MQCSSLNISFLFSNIHLHQYSVMCRITREPELEQWTTMAECCDMLHEPVCPKHKSNSQCQYYICILLPANWFVKVIELTGPHCHCGEVYKPFRCIPLYTKGALSYYLTMDFLWQMIYTLFCRTFCRLLCMLLLLAERSFLWTGFQLATLNPQPQKRLLLIFSPNMVYIVAYSIAWQKNAHIAESWCL